MHASHKRGTFIKVRNFYSFFKNIINDWGISPQVSWGIWGGRGPSHIYLFYGEASSKKRRRRGRKKEEGIVRKEGLPNHFQGWPTFGPGIGKKDFENRTGTEEEEEE